MFNGKYLLIPVFIAVFSLMCISSGSGEGGSSCTCCSIEPCDCSFCSICSFCFCGNGKLDSFFGEECDDGNRIDGDGCSSECLLEDPCIIRIGDFCTQTQGGWGQSCNDNNPGCMRDNYWDTVINGSLVVGNGYNITLTSSTAVENFLPQGKPPLAPLAMSHIDPVQTESGVLAGQLTALKLNILFSDAGIGLNGPNSNMSIGELIISTGKFEWMSVYDFLALAEIVLGNTTSYLDPYNASVSELNDAATYINENFVDCLKNNGYLEIPGCREGFCGDDVVNESAGEECDDGELNGIPCEPPYDGSCTYCSEVCKEINLTDGYCGDGIIQESYEECETDADCSDHNPHTIDTCVNCTCEHEYVPYCGDGVINLNEQCEFPNTNNNIYCNQITQKCSGNRLGVRDESGFCNSSCGCIEDPFEYSCVKGECDAECSNDTDCPDTICESGCVGNDYYEYDNVSNTCTCSCVCTQNQCGEPTIYYNDSRCTQCQDDDDCNYLDRDYCNETKVKHDEGICVDYVCTINTTTTECDNGLYCDGQETCEEINETPTCISETPVNCDDNVSCTSDSCNETSDSCDNIPDDGLCDDGLYCNGKETCNAQIGCWAGAPVDCSGNNLDQIETCLFNPDNINFTWDYFAGFTSWCDEENDRCTTGIVNLTHACSVSECQAECDDQNTCEPNMCSETYNDYCNNSKLVEYDDDKILDFTTINDSCDNQCLEDCTCTDCPVDCSAPETNEYCVKGVCDAECAAPDDCPEKCTQQSHKLYTQVECTDCSCEYSKYKCVVGKCGATCDEDEDCGCPSDFCNGTTLVDYPEHGYCGTAGEEGCLCQNDTAEEGQCKPELIYNAPECQAECVYIGTIIDQFHGNLYEKLLEFPFGNYSNYDAKISYNFSDLVVLSATLYATGLPTNITTEGIVDAALVEDVSGSMDDDCGPDGKAQPGETPCKINDKKDADINFVNTLLDNNETNMIALVAYSTDVVDSLGLTNNRSLLLEHINSYEAAGTTCISCGIEEGIQLLKNGINPNRVMVLMSDGKANECIKGICSLEEAREEAINKSREAWEQYNITVYAVAYGADADTGAMQEIADAGHGKYYFADNFNISQIYEDIAQQIIQSYPYNPYMDAGSNGVKEWSYSGVFDVSEQVNFTQDLKDIIENCSCPGCSIQGGECVIDLEFFSERTGKILLDRLNITACTYTELLDEDDDGYNSIVDCNDTNPDINPGASENCANGVDDDCDGLVDSEDPECQCQDNDGDGYGEGYGCLGSDCDDNNSAIYPGTAEVCNGVDDDCDGYIDEDNVCGYKGDGGITGGGTFYITGGAVCTENWSCSDWSECSQEGMQTRTCTDLNECRTEKEKPAEEKTCTYMPPQLLTMCNPGVKVCADDDLMECSEDIHWNLVKACEYGCLDDKCNPESGNGMVTGEGEGAGASGLAGYIMGNPATFYGLIVLILVILGAGAYWKFRK